ncbi:unnamed protein product [Urochloa humidicola]
MWRQRWSMEAKGGASSPMLVVVDYSSSNTSGSTTATSGTALSTPGCFTPQSSDGLDPILDLSLSWWVDQDREMKVDFIKCLFDDFCAADGDATVLERWLPEMGVVDVSAANFLRFAGSWIRALTEIAPSIRNACLTAKLSVPQQQPLRAQLARARFAKALISKMTPFVDAIASPPCTVGVADGAPLQPLMGAREAVSRASQDIRLTFCSTTSKEAKMITAEISSLLLEKQAKLEEAIWTTIEGTKTSLLASSWWGTQAPQGISPDIHKATRATVSHINILSTNYATLYRIVEQAVQLRGYVPKIDNVSPFTSVIMETLSCLEQKLAEESRSFTDQSMRLLFLINNSYFIWQQFYPTNSILESHMSDLARKIDNYIEAYLQVSWAPVLLCLYNSTPLCLGIYPSPAKFEAEFRKTYAAQKLWKVPDPKLRRRLRVAVTEKIVSSFTKYLKYNNISSSRITPQDLMDMLQELFEG